jgi:hypothetical protein
MKEKMKKIYWKVALSQLDGVGVIEVILILVIIIGIVLIFREKIGEIIFNAFNSISSSARGAGAQITVTP